MKNLIEVPEDEQRTFFNSFDYVLSDMDGVIWTKYEIHKGARQCIATFKQTKKRVHYVTNNSMLTADHIAKVLQKSGIEATADDVTNPITTTIGYLKNIGFQGKLYVMATENFREQIRNAGFEIAPLPAYPIIEDITGITENLSDDKNVKGVLIGLDVNLTYISLQKALVYLKRDDCILLVSGGDKYIPLGPLGPLIGAAHFSQILSEMSNRELNLVAKPSKHTYMHLNRILGIQNPERALLIGDSIVMDMHQASLAGYKKLLVLSGHAKIEDLKDWKQPEEWMPDYYVEDLQALYTIQKKLFG